MILEDHQESNTMNVAARATVASGKSADEQQLSMLVHRLQAGDRYALATLLDLVTPCISPIISRFVWNHADAQDIMQEVALQLYRALPNFRAECQVLTFVYRVTLNVCMNCKKRITRQPVTFTDLTSPDNTEQLDSRISSSSVSTPEHINATREREEALRLMIYKLDPKFRAVLIMTDICGMSQQEIAEILHAPLNTIKSRQKRAREAMKKQILAQRELFGRVD